jgi:dTDP-glucose 4,6-dehydratase
MNKILITGGAGFIGSNFIRYINAKSPDNIVINIDKLTYAGNINNLDDIKESSKYHFIQADINSSKQIYEIISKYQINVIINFAAETHVDNSIANPTLFIETNVLGTANLLETARRYWNEVGNNDKQVFIQISTDEVYGSLEENESSKFIEDTPIAPNSPYSASKAGADLLVMSYFNTYKFPAIITRCSNNYGAFQHTEKFIPFMITNALNNNKLPIYGDGMNIRDWIYVDDHCDAILKVLNNGRFGEIYNIGADDEKHNIDIAKLILDYLEKPYSLIEYVDDRLGHDRRYAIDSTKIMKELNWKPNHKFEDSIIKTIEWYKNKIAIISNI